MSRDTIDRGIDLAFSRGDARLTFFGGEPLLEFDRMVHAVRRARDVARHTGKRLRRFSVTVNGTLLNRDNLAFLRDEGFFLVISLDGGKEASADRVLEDGSAAYDRILQGVTLATEYMNDLHISAVVDPANVHLMSASFGHFLSIGVNRFSFNFNYDGAWTPEHLNVFRMEIEHCADLYVDAYRSGISVDFKGFTSKIRTHLHGGYPPGARCPFGDGEVTLTPSGRLYPCERLVGEDPPDSPLCIGNIEFGIDLVKVLSFARAKNAPAADCRTCSVVDRCTYFCGCVNWATTGTIGDVSGLLCEVEQTVIAQADRAAGILFQERNPLFLERFYSMPGAADHAGSSGYFI